MSLRSKSLWSLACHQEPCPDEWPLRVTATAGSAAAWERKPIRRTFPTGLATFRATMSSEAKPALRLVRGGRSEIRIGPLLVTVAPPDAPPFDTAATVLEEDTWLVLSAETEIKQPAESMVLIMTELLRAEPKALGSVLVEKGEPLRLLAVVYDLAREPICSPEWVGKALQGIFAVAEEKGLTTLALPLLGVRHGRLPIAGFVELLAEEVRKVKPRALRRIWLTAAGPEVRKLRQLLKSI